MALLGEEQEWDRARIGRAFGDYADAEAWMSIWCDDCVTDAEQCPLIHVALSGCRIPRPWQDRGPVSVNRYICHEYQTATEEQP